ncbi:MAG: hypothetical protein WD768_17930 [Phycisphaeraceae bacterium]
MKRMLTLAALSAAFAIASSAHALSVPVVLPTLVNGDFETGAAAFANGVGYVAPINAGNPTEITGWPGSGNRGINPIAAGGSPFRDNGNNSTHVAFMQGNGSNIGQSMSDWQVGTTYRVAFDYNARANGTAAPFVGITATAGGASFIDSSVPPVNALNVFTNRYNAGNILLTAATATNSITFTANVTSGDRTLLVDNVRVFRNGPVILDNGFENPVQPANQFEQASGTGGGSLVGSNWAFTGGAGITRNISPFQNGSIPAPEGEQHALMQGNSGMTQNITGFELGSEYELSLLAMARQSGATPGNDLEVILDQGLATQIILLDLAHVGFTSFTELTSPVFTALKQSYTLTVRTTLNGGQLTGDRTTFIDNVWFNYVAVAVPEPATAMLALFSAAGLIARRRRIA